MDSVEQYSRHKNVEIHGVERKENENLLKWVADLTVKSDPPQPGRETIKALDRFRTKQETKVPIIIRSQDRNSIRDFWIRKTGVLRNLRIYINENLAVHLKCFLWVTSIVAREAEFRFVWARNGKLFARQTEEAAVIRIENKGDIEKLR